MEKKSLKINFIMNTLLQGTSYLLPFILTPYVTRILQPAGMGKVSFATSTLLYFIMLVMLGIPTYGIRVCAKLKDDREKLSKTVHELFFINTIMAVLAYAVLFILICCFDKFNQTKSLLLVMSIAIPLNVLGMEWLYKGLEEYIVIAKRALIIRLLVFVSVFIFVRDEGDFLIYGLLSMVSAYGAHLLNFIGSRKYVSWNFIHKYDLKKHIKPSLMFLAISISSTIYINLDVVMLGLITNDVQTGYYDASLNIKNYLTAAVTSIGLVLLPRVCSYVAANKMDKFIDICKRVFNIVWMISIALMLYFLVYTPEFVTVFCGTSFNGSILPLRILLPTTILIGTSNLIGIQMLVPLKKENKVLLSTVIGAITNLFLNSILIKNYGAVGVAIGTTISELMVVIIQLFCIKSYLHDLLSCVSYLKILTSGILATLLSLVCKSFALSSILSLIISASIFFITYGLCLIVFKEKETILLINSIKDVLIRKLKHQKEEI